MAEPRENKRFLPSQESRAHWVSQSLDGVVHAAAGTHSALVRLAATPDVKVVLRADWPPAGPPQVALVSGGGAGHEPAHAGFVGPGMLTAAVVGEVFASPSVDAVLAAILAVTVTSQTPGCVLVVMNYAGDRMNFGLAAERARAPPHNRDVRMVMVGDDVALAKSSHQWRHTARGIAGTLFVHKIAGAAAAAGASIEQVFDQATAAANAVFSIGVALTQCLLPGRQYDVDDRIGKGNMELGLGIHGEPGAQTIPIQPVNEILQHLVARLQSVPGRMAVLLNNLGAVPAMEMSIILDQLLKGSMASRIALLIGPATMMTSLQMNGFSLSCLSLDPDPTWFNKLLEPVPMGAWPTPARIEHRQPTLVPLPDLRDPLAVPCRSENTEVETLLRAGLTRLQMPKVQQELNDLDGKLGDADAGDTLANASSRILEAIPNLPLDSPGNLCLAIGSILGRSGGGTSGVLLSIFFTATGRSWLAGSNSWPTAAKAGVSAMMELGGAMLGDRTMLDALIPALDALKLGVRQAADAAREGAQKTAEMAEAAAGRASYVSDILGVVDPGAQAVAEVFDAVACAAGR